jgi:hyperosmotically inducible periplasmic protein
MRIPPFWPTAAIVACTALTALGSLPPAPAEVDRQIETSARNSYNFKKYLRNDNVRIASADGVVTLTGTVSETYHKFLAQETVLGLPAVKRVDNLLVVAPNQPSEHSDIWITMQVKMALLFHKNVDATATEAHTEDGVVTLSGKAGSEAKKTLTGEYAMDVEGVREVRNNLVVAPGLRDLGDMVDDASITAQIKASLLFRKSTHALATQVATRDGVVTLHGEARDVAEKDLVTRIAQDTQGVTQVDNRMSLRQP